MGQLPFDGISVETLLIEIPKEVNCLTRKWNNVLIAHLHQFCGNAPLACNEIDVLPATTSQFKRSGESHDEEPCEIFVEVLGR